VNRHVLRVLAAALLSLATASAALLLGTGLTGEGTPPPDPDLTVVGLGDSVMAGTACGCTGIAAQYAAAWGKQLDRRVHAVNLGISGDTTSALSDRLDGDSQTRTALRSADVVLVIEGANDLSPQYDTWEASSCPSSCYHPAVLAMGSRLRAVLAKIRTLAPAQAQLVVAGYWNVFADGDAAREDGGQAEIDWSRAITKDANSAILSASRTTHASYVDLTPAFDPDGDSDPTPLLADDGDHPNQAGVTQIVSALLSATSLPSR
jgi:lysophospholipase L1-like esterase